MNRSTILGRARIAAAVGMLIISLAMRTRNNEDGMAREILEYVNEARAAKGLGPLQMNAYESSIATGHSRDMASGKVPFGHDGMDARIRQINRKLGPIHGAGENVAYGQMTAREVVDGWMHSTGHRKNIEGNYQLTGIGYATDSRGTIYFTEIFTN